MTIHFDIYVNEGSDLRMFPSWACSLELTWGAVMQNLNQLVKPNRITSVKYRDSDGDMVTIVDDKDYKEAKKSAFSQAANQPTIEIVLELEESKECNIPLSPSEASVATLTSNFSEVLDMAALKKEIVDSVLLELRSHGKKLKKKRNQLKKEPICGGCNKLVDLNNSVYFKCGNCKCFLLCEACEHTNGRCSASNSHVFVKFRHQTIKPRFLNKKLLSQLVVKPQNIEEPENASISTVLTEEPPVQDSPRSSSTSLIVFDDDANSAPVEKQDAPESEKASLVVSQDTSEDDDDEDSDFLMVPLPACFDLNRPLDDKPAVEQPSLEICESEKSMAVSQQNGQASLEMAVQRDLEGLAEAMSTESEQAPVPSAPPRAETPSRTEASQAFATPPEPPAFQDACPVVEPVNPSPSVPSSPASPLINIAASISDSVPPALNSAPKAPIDQLVEMGFGDRRFNAQLLQHYNGNIEQVVNHLVTVGNDQLSFDVL